MKKKIAILGSTGSIGTQTLEVIAHHPERFQVEALAAGRNLDVFVQQIQKFSPSIISVADEPTARKLQSLLPSYAKHVVWGEEGMIKAAAHHDAELVVTAVVGSQGLKPTLAAIEAGKHIGLANKETLVSGGHLVMEAANKKGVSILPVDSEHSAIYQCLNGEALLEVDKLILTASGGAFRDFSREQLKHVTVEDALKHPNWSMGSKITIDSATMVNKGLEVIEAHWLFQMPYDRIDVVIHPQSIVHSMVQFQDYSVIAQMGLPDMKVPIQYALTYPERLPSPGEPLDFSKAIGLDFKPVNMELYPCFKLALESGRAGGTAPTVFNAANEEVVQLFLNRQISFLDMEHYIQAVLDRHHIVTRPVLEQITSADQWARQQVLKQLKEQS